MTPILAFDIETVPDVAGIRRVHDIDARILDGRSGPRHLDGRRQWDRDRSRRHRIEPGFGMREAGRIDPHAAEPALPVEADAGLQV